MSETWVAKLARRAAGGEGRGLERWASVLVWLGAATMWLGALMAVLRGAKLFSQDLADMFSDVLVPVGGGLVILALALGIALAVRNRSLHT